MKTSIGFWLWILCMLLFLCMIVGNLCLSYYHPLIYEPEDLGNMNSVETLDFLKKRVMELMDFIKSIIPRPESDEKERSEEVGTSDFEKGKWVMGAMNISSELSGKSLEEITAGFQCLVENTSASSISPDTISNFKTLLHGIDDAAEAQLKGKSRKFNIETIKAKCLIIHPAIRRLDTLPKQ